MIAVWLAAVLGLAPTQSVEWVAHRGESADAPENTMAAFRLAWDRKDEAIELDVHLSKDGALIVSHDADTKRTTGVAKKIKDTHRDELVSLDAGRWKDVRWSGETLPTLDEALATIPAGARCFIEIKVGPEAVPALVDSVKRSGKKPEQMAIISFQAETVAESKRRLPDLKTYYLASFRKDKAGVWQPGIDELIAKAKAIRADGLDLSAKGPLDHAQVERVKAAGLALYVWTVDDPDEAQRFVDMGVDGITTNRAAYLRERSSRR